MKNLLEIRTVRVIVMVTLTLLAFTSPIYLLEIFQVPTLISAWFSIVIGLFTLTGFSEWETNFGTDKQKTFSQIFEDVKDATYTITMCAVLIYIPIRGITAALLWLKHGYWQSYTTCDALGWFCINTTNYVGLNKILDVFGQNDFGYLVGLLSAVMYWHQEANGK